VDFRKGVKRSAEIFLDTCLILTFCELPKKKQTAALRAIYMCQKFIIFKTS
jgi:hypothetical protein